MTVSANTLPDKYLHGGDMYIALSGDAGLSTGVVPEPSTIVIWSLLGIAAFWVRRRRRSAK